MEGGARWPRATRERALSVSLPTSKGIRATLYHATCGRNEHDKRQIMRGELSELSKCCHP